MKNSLTRFPVKILALVALVIITILPSSQAFGKEWSAAQKEVWKMQEASWELWKKGDVDGRLALYHKDCIVWLYNTAFTGDRTLIKREMIKYSEIESFELEPQDVKVFGNFAIVLYSLNYTAFGKDYNERVKANWIKQDDKWQIISSMRAQQPSEFPKQVDYSSHIVIMISWGEFTSNRMMNARLHESVIYKRKNLSKIVDTSNYVVSSPILLK